MKKFYYVMMVFALVFVLFGNTTTTQAQTFKDVSTDEPYYEAVEQLAELGIITKAEKFNPQNTLTRGQMAKMMVLSLNLDTKDVKDPKFKDVPKSHEFYPYIAALVNAGVVKGYSDGTYGVNKKVTRAHMAKFVVNGFGFEQRNARVPSLDKNTEVEKNVATLRFYEIIGYSTSKQSEPLLRFEAAEMITSAMIMASLDEVTIPFSEVVKTAGEFESVVTEGEDFVAVKADNLNKEIVLYPLAKGNARIAIESGQESVTVQLSIDNNLDVTYEVVEVPVEEYPEVEQPTEDTVTPNDTNELATLEILSDMESPIRKAYMEQITGDKSEKRSLKVSSQSEDGRYGYVEVSSDKVGEIFKITFEHADGKNEEIFIKVKKTFDFSEIKQLIVGTEKSVNSYVSTDVKLRKGNADAVKVITEKYDGYTVDYYEITELGTYEFEDKEDPENSLGIVIEVMKVEGKLMVLMEFEDFYSEEYLSSQK